ncbi:FAD binding domain-containing protein [Colletotrichum costaricense]|uniref:FAD binding domain-containing protein n=1 Tax=Colletotrichum costaricense TaxID=1209916 RepID=A0AAI9YMQ0_9PEZI|nr:FAD binding domain-containing protein [Colletotrichum costaricense]KAK1515973.1 FAD binding domain-containing protein [Colletotrichum costaricense]
MLGPLPHSSTKFELRDVETGIPGSNNINGGVLLALNRLRHLKVVGNGELIEAGPGNRWIDIYNALDPYGRYAIGGRGKSIGISGLSLIGGFHYFNNKYGFAMDNVVSYDVVLGNGTQVVANATTHSDLFWALKGGVNNFGVVTRFIYKTFEARQISTTIQEFDEGAIPAFIKAVCDFVEADDPSIAAGGVVTIQKNATTKLISARIMGVQEGANSPPHRFSNFSTISATSRVDNVTTPKIWHSMLESPYQMFRNTYGQHAIKPNSDAIYGMYKQWRDAVDDISDVQGLYPTFILNMSPKSSARVAKTNGIGNTWGLDDNIDEIWWQFSTGWDREEDDLRITSWTRSLLARLHSENRLNDLASSEFVYMGDASETQNVFAGFPVENIERMREIRGRYDELGVFTTLNWGGFKLGY